MATWIVCAGMIRSGSTVQYQITSDLASTYLGAIPLGYVEPQDVPALYETHPAADGPYVIKMHAFAPEVAALAAAHEAQVLYIYRDIRDVMVSLMNKLDRSFWYILFHAHIRRALTHSDAWTSVTDVQISQYEQTVDHLTDEVHRIATVLGIELPASAAAALAERYSLNKQRSRMHQAQAAGPRSHDEQGAAVRKPSSELHHNHIHSGRSEQWRTALSPFQVAVLEYAAQDWLVERGYRISQGRIQRWRAAPAHYALTAGAYLRAAAALLRHPRREGWKMKRRLETFSFRVPE